MPPLDGIKVVDLTRILAGPFCTMLLGDMGAQVVKIEEPEAGDESRGWAPFVGGWSSYFLGVNRSKKSVALNIKDPADAATLRSLVAGADVLVENFRPGSLAKLGFGYDDMERLNRGLVYCSITGYGQSGPRSHLPGYDVVIQGEAGLMDVTGPAAGPPTRVGIAVTDYLAGLYAMQGILLALRERDRSGRGQHVDIGLFDALMSALALPVGIFSATGETPRRMGNEHPSIAPYEAFEARDGAVIVAVGNPRLWKQFCAALSIDALEADPRFKTNGDRLANRSVLKQALADVFAQQTVDDVIARLEAHGVPCGRVRSIAEALDDPQVQAREMLLDVRPADVDRFKSLGNPIKLSRTPCAIHLPPPRLGEHTEEIVSALSRSASDMTRPVRA